MGRSIGSFLLPGCGRNGFGRRVWRPATNEARLGRDSSHLEFLVHYSGSQPTYEKGACFARHLQMRPPRLPVSEWQSTRRYLVSLGVRQETFASMLAQASKGPMATVDLLDSPLRSEVQPKAQFLQVLGLSSSEVGAIIATQPEVFAASLGQQRKVVSWLTEHGHLNPVGVIQTLKRAPMILTLDVDKELAPLGNAMTRIGMSRSHSERAILTDPAILFKPVEEGLLSVVSFLLTNQFQCYQVPDVISLYPSLITTSICQLELRLRFMREELRLMPPLQTLHPEFLSASITAITGPRHDWLLHRWRKHRPKTVVTSRLSRYHIEKEDRAFCHLTHSRYNNFLAFKDKWKRGPRAKRWAAD